MRPAEGEFLSVGRPAPESVHGFLRTEKAMLHDPMPCDITLFADCLPVVDDGSPPIAVETWAAAALRELEGKNHVRHYLQIPYKHAYEAVGVAIERLARSSTGSVRLFCSTKTIVGRAAIEVLTPLARTVIYPVG